MKLFIKEFFLPCLENNYYPLFFKKNFLYFYIFFIFLLKILTIPIIIFLPQNIFFANVVKEVLIDLVNQERKKYNLPLLKENPLLEKSSFLKAQDMLKNNYFSHWSPNGISPWYWFLSAGYDYQYAGENLAIGFLTSEEVFEAWMNSPTHRMNILNPNYQEIGITVEKGYFDGREVYLIVQHFGTPKKVFSSTLNTQVPKPVSSSQSMPSSSLILASPSFSPSASQIISSTPPSVSPIISSTLPIVAQEETTLPPNVETKLEGVSDVQKKSNFVSLLESEQNISLSSKIKKFFVRFFLQDYHSVLNIFIYSSLILVIFSLITTLYFDYFVYHKFVIDYKDLIPRIMLFSLILIFFGFFDYLKIAQLIPHDFLI